MSKTRTSLSRTTLLILVSLAVSPALALKTPKDHESNQGDTGLDSKESLVNFHGLDYDNDLHNQLTSEEDKKHVKNTEDNKSESSSSNVNATSLTWNSDEYYDDWDSYWGSSEEDYFWDLQGILKNNNQTNTSDKTQTHEAVDSHVLVQTAPKDSDKRENVDKAEEKQKSEEKADQKLPSKPDYEWGDDGDDDDGENAEKKIGNNINKNKEKPLDNLPSDNDQDATKYFSPERYAESVKLHVVEDIFNNQWTVLYQDTNLPCIMLSGKIKFIVPVTPSWTNKNFIEIEVPNNAVASGTCHALNNDYQDIKLQWNVTVPERNEPYLNTVYFGFATNKTSEITDQFIPEDQYALVSVTATYYNGEIEEIDDDGVMSYSVTDMVDFLTPMNMSMSCYRDKQLILGDMQLTLSKLQMEAFRPNSEIITPGMFSPSASCPSDEVVAFDAVMTFIIWFWIGALSLVLIVFVVLLALGHRRKSTQQEGGFGYKILRV